jgi:hypothetical protein
MLAVEIDIKTAQRPASLIIINLPADLSMVFQTQHFQPSIF